METPCEIWAGSKNPDGYGHARLGGKVINAHRLAWIKANGPIPAGMLVCHHCDNPPCVRVDHLFLGTQKDNIADAMRKGRFVGGSVNGPPSENAHKAKLSWDDVRLLREVYKQGASLAELSRRFGVTRSTARKAAIGLTWVVK